MGCITSPKIQRLVTPLRLQRRRHLNSIKRRRLERQKEQKTEYEFVYFFPGHTFLRLTTCFLSAFFLPSVLQKGKKRRLPSKLHTRSKHLHNNDETHLISLRFKDRIIIATFLFLSSASRIYGTLAMSLRSCFFYQVTYNYYALPLCMFYLHETCSALRSTSFE